jgi:hypothetical protein
MRPPPTGVSAIAIAAGDTHTCAIVTKGGLMCWGMNYYGQLGIEMKGKIEYEPRNVTGAVRGSGQGARRRSEGIGVVKVNVGGKIQSELKRETLSSSERAREGGIIRFNGGITGRRSQLGHSVKPSSFQMSDWLICYRAWLVELGSLQLVPADQAIRSLQHCPSLGPGEDHPACPVGRGWGGPEAVHVNLAHRTPINCYNLTGIYQVYTCHIAISMYFTR